MISGDEYRELIDFLGKQFGKVDRHFVRVEERLGGVEARLGGVEDRIGRVEGRLARVEVSFESFRDDQRALAEGITGNRAAIERNGEAIAAVDAKVEVWISG